MLFVPTPFALGGEDLEEFGEGLSVEEINALRKKMKIKVDGSDVPEPLRGFGDLSSHYGLPEFLPENIAAAGYKEPTRIQMQV